MKKVLLIALPLGLSVLAGCATVRDTYGSDGRKSYALNCSGQARGWDKCFTAAGQICGPRGYDVLNRSAEASGTTASRYEQGRVSTERTMLIACKY